MVTTFEINARADKVFHMVRRVRRLGISWEIVETWTDHQWEALAVMVGKNPASEATRSDVINILKQPNRWKAKA